MPKVVSTVPPVIKKREIFVTVTESWVVIETCTTDLKGCKKFGVGMLTDEWFKLMNVKDHVTYLLEETKRKLIQLILTIMMRRKNVA